MSYPPLPAAEGASAEGAIRALLTDLASRKEFNTSAPPPHDRASWSGYAAELPGLLVLPGLRLSGAQHFVQNFESPDTDYARLLIQWQTGVGKSIAFLSIASQFIRQYRARAALGERAPSVFVISFTAHETIQEDLLRYPEFGFVSVAEAEELRRLRAAAAAAGAASAEARQLSGFSGNLRRRFTDRARGGYYRFYGYKEFANAVFAVTRQGAARGFSVQSLYGRAEGAFGERIAEAVRRGDVVVNEELLDEMRGGLLGADEIHNVYNIVEANNYCIAIQYALDALGAEAPRAVFMSATIMTGSASEIVDLLNLLVPRAALPGGMLLRRADFFVRTAAPGGPQEEGAEEGAEEGPAFVVSQLREGALERIARYSAGRVSFLLDADVGTYPRRIFVGEEAPGVPYLRLTPCPMSPFHAQTLAHEQGLRGRGEAAGLATRAYSLYDIAFPNPSFPPDAAETGDPAAYGLYTSGETPHRLAHAPDEWRAAAGVVVERGLAAEMPVITGEFLGPGRLPHYSTKYAKMVEIILAAMRAGPGKIMVSHPRVRMGVLVVQEILRMAGFSDEDSAPTDATLCAVCTVPRAAHGAAHPYAPARFVVAHSEIERTLMLRSIARFVAPANLSGYQHRVLIGSSVVEESLNFPGVRHQVVLLLPTDYPTLVQLFGRVARRNSHRDLPEDQQDVRIHILVSTRADGRASPDLQRYVEKGREYLVIQEVARATHTYALDGFANWDRICAALGWRPGAPPRASLDALPYAPAVGPTAVPSAPRLATFEAYGHGEREVATLAAVCRVLFRARAVWTYEDLWAAVRAGAVRGVSRDPASFDEGNFALALEGLARPAGAPPTLVARAGPYFVRARANPDGSPALDIESYLRDFPSSTAPGPAPAPVRVTVKVADYLREARSGQGFAVRLRAFEGEYLRPGAPSAPEFSLVEYGAEFHYALIRSLVAARPGARTTSDDERVKEVYRRFRVVVTAAEAAAAGELRASQSKAPGDLVGYLTPEAVSLYDSADSPARWYSAPLARFGIGRRHLENDIVVGFVAPVGRAAAAPRPRGEEFSAASAAVRFKIRLPIHRLAAAAGKKGDVRALARGAVCETRPRDELREYGRRLRDVAARTGVLPPGVALPGQALGGGCGCGGAGERPGPSAQHSAGQEPARAAHARPPSANEICVSVRRLLLALEANARAPASGMMDGLRWLYLYCDRAPTVSALMGRK